MKPTTVKVDTELDPSAAARPLLSGSGYGRLKRKVVLATASVALVPLVIMTLVNFYQYRKDIESTTFRNISQMLTNNKRSLDFFLSERMSALDFIIRDRTLSELSDANTLGRIMRNVNESFTLGSFVDLGVIDSKGEQVCYTGPYDLKGRNYSEQEWFHRVTQRGAYTSNVFLGHRNSPHFAMATRHEVEGNDYFILRATFDAEMLNDQIHTTGLSPNDDIFLTDRQGVLQTPSRRYGHVTSIVPFDVPRASPRVEIFQHEDEDGQPILIAYASITESPFLLVFLRPMRQMTGEWVPAMRLVAFLAISALLILGVVFWASGQFVKNLRAISLRRAAIMHKVEYSNKLASIGRLAAGVAHEINNPLAVINQKTGLLQDLVTMEGDTPQREKLLGLIGSVMQSVERCKKITHRLLGFAKQMDVQHEEIDVPSLLQEVVDFVGKEAEYRNIRVTVKSEESVPRIESDRGQLQQVFVNLLNNAVSAVKDGGEIDITVDGRKDNQVSVTVADNGVGIPEANLKRIFEPFFTTREGAGTGLGLSITYGIVQKLGGEISVASEVGKGTQFTVSLPIKREG